jgi:hypothetical protein
MQQLSSPCSNYHRPLQLSSCNNFHSSSCINRATTIMVQVSPEAYRSIAEQAIFRRSNAWKPTRCDKTVREFWSSHFWSSPEDASWIWNGLDEKNHLPVGGAPTLLRCKRGLVENGNLLCPFSPIPLAKATLCEEHEGGANTMGLGGWERKVSVQRNGTVRVESVIPTGKHEGAMALHERFCLDVEITKNFIRSPSTDDVSIHATVEKCHRTRCW